jgi:lysophospholipase L1-like esterase
MATRIFFPALAIAIALAGCGGGGDDPALEAQAAPATHFTQAGCASTLQLFGDSTMDEEIGAAPHWIAKWGPRIVNRAVGGTNSSALVDGYDGLNAPWPASTTAKYAVINHGLNDGYLPFPRAYTPLPEYIENLRTLASAPGAEVIFQTPVPATRNDRDMTLYAQAMRDVAAEKGLKVIDVFACFQRQPNWQARIPDGTHPDAEGLRYIVETCAAPVVEALPCR